MSTQKTIMLFMFLFFLGLMLAACSTPEETPTPSPVPEVEEMEIEEEAETISKDIDLDPATVSLDDDDSLLVCGYIYDGLVSDASGEIVPALASSWEVSEDGLNYVFTLRGNAAFSDDTPVVADIVVTNFERWFDQEHPLHGDGVYEAWETHFLGFKGESNDDGTPLSIFDGIEKVDQLTVVVHLNQPFPELLSVLSMPSFSILSPEILEAAADGGSLEPVGTGAYVVSNWTGDELVLEPNSAYWGEIPTEGIKFKFE